MSGKKTESIDHINNTNLLLLKNPQNEEVLKVKYNGNFYYKGKLITNDKEIVKSFRKFLNIE